MAQYGLSKPEKLRKRREFLTASREAEQRRETKNFLILLRPNREKHSRLGITVTKKIGKAVVRNRIKRHVREFYRTNKHLLPPEYDILVIARRGAGGLTHRLVQNQLSTLINQLQKK